MALSFPKQASFTGPLDVIDTSNLVAYVGTLNMLISALSLLIHTPNAILDTEHLATDKFYAGPFDRLKSLFCGDPAAMFFLLGARSIECLTKVHTTSSIVEEALHSEPRPNIV